MKIFFLASLLEIKPRFFYTTIQYKNIPCVCTTSLHAVNSVKYRVGSNLITRAVCIPRKKNVVFCTSSNMSITYLTVQKTYCIFVICLLFTPPGPLLSPQKTTLDLRSWDSGEVVMTRGFIFPQQKHNNDLCWAPSFNIFWPEKLFLTMYLTMGLATRLYLSSSRPQRN